MNISILIGAQIFILTGLVLALRSMWLRKPDHPSIDGSMKIPDLFKSPKVYKNYYEGNGYKYLLAGMLFFLFGLALNIIYFMFACV